MSGYTCRHFKLTELVDKPIYDAMGIRAWHLLDPRLLITLDAFRDRYGRTLLNTWAEGGPRHESVLRIPNTTTGAVWSQHKMGRAADPVVPGKDPREIYNDILANAGQFQYLTCMEDIDSTPTWNHLDVRNHQADQQIIIVKP